ncbi:MAG: molybdopterin biosynthesis protein [Ignisphaera sp.]|nr:molybdopterin biosynthesis protein [Ignisphaera sp.]MDW8085467.1 molybdopterin biosynthesis protein [Ignisphaera sp.]
MFHRLISIDETLDILDREGVLKPIGVEEVRVEDSLGRVLAEDIYAPIDYPPFDRSEVDGYAISLRSVEGVDELHPAELRIIGKISVGEKPNVNISIGEAVEIDTGAMIPRGADGVVMEEYTDRINQGRVRVYRGIYPGENVAHAGSDISLGELVIPRGTRVSFTEIGVLATLGIDKIKVFKTPRILVISTGNELIEPGKELEPGKLYDTNGYIIAALLKSMGLKVALYGIVKDEEETLYRVISDKIDEYDIVVTSGGTSAGNKDVVYRVFNMLGRVVVHGLKVKPGKPTVIAISHSGKLLVGLPGFPLSSLTHSLLLLRRIVEKIVGAECSDRMVKASISARFRKDIGRAWLIPVVMNRIDGNVYAIPLIVPSGSISVMINADGIAVLPETLDVVEEGMEVNVHLIREYHAREGLVMGSHDILLPEIIHRMNLHRRLVYIPVGSYRGLELIGKGYIDIAPIHIFNPESNSYNIDVIRSDETLRNVALIVRGYGRRLVLAFRKGNPKNIKSYRDIVREDVRFINRNRGSGTRTYIDFLLERVARELGKAFKELTKTINGYSYEVSTHNGVAAAISQDRADVGICIEYAAVKYGLDYIPLTMENYDFVIFRKSIEKPAIRDFITMLKDNSIKSIIQRHPGYQPYNDTGEIICC